MSDNANIHISADETFPSGPDAGTLDIGAYGVDHVALSYPDNENGYDDGETTGPAAWLNSAQIHVNDRDDSVTVTISVGDPRGAFAFTVRRLPDGAPDHAGRLIMHLPQPADSMLHESLSELHPGTYLIGD